MKIIFVTNIFKVVIYFLVLKEYGKISNQGY